MYKILCSDCQRCYSGHTKQLLKNKIQQHKYDCRQIHRDNERKTALSEHHLEEHHQFDFENVTILDKEKHWLKRNISEMVHIKLNNSVNNRTDTQNLGIVYDNILNLYKNNIRVV